MFLSGRFLLIAFDRLHLSAVSLYSRSEIKSMPLVAYFRKTSWRFLNRLLIYEGMTVSQVSLCDLWRSDCVLTDLLIKEINCYIFKELYRPSCQITEVENERTTFTMSAAANAEVLLFFSIVHRQYFVVFETPEPTPINQLPLWFMVIIPLLKRWLNNNILFITHEIDNSFFFASV